MISIEEYDEKVREAIESLEEIYVKEQSKDTEKDEAKKLLKRIGFSLQNVMAYAELRKKLFKED